MNVGFLVGGIVGVVVVAPLVVLLFAWIIRLGRDSRSYADDILANGVVLTGDLDPVPALLETQRLVHRATAAAVRYVNALERLA
jgi:hypothetical protein